MQGDVANYSSPVKQRKWLIAIGVGGFIAITAVLVFVIIGLQQHWGNAQFGPLATWVAGGLTLAGLGVALEQSARARREAADAKAATDRQLVQAERDREAADERLKSDRRDFERRRRVDLEISQRLRYVDSARRLITDISEVSMVFIDHVSDLTIGFSSNKMTVNDAAWRHSEFLTLWANCVSRINAECLILRGARLDEPVIEFLQDFVEAASLKDAIQDRNVDEIEEHRNQWREASKGVTEFNRLVKKRCDVDLSAVEKYIDETWQIP